MPYVEHLEMYFEELYVRLMAIESQIEDADGQERAELLRDKYDLERALEIEHKTETEDEVVAEWDKQVERGEKPDLFAGLPDWVRRRMLGGQD